MGAARLYIGASRRKGGEAPDWALRAGRRSRPTATRSLHRGASRRKGGEAPEKHVYTLPSKNMCTSTQVRTCLPREGGLIPPSEASRALPASVAAAARRPPTNPTRRARNPGSPPAAPRRPLHRARTCGRAGLTSPGDNKQSASCTGGWQLYKQQTQAP